MASWARVPERSAYAHARIAPRHGQRREIAQHNGELSALHRPKPRPQHCEYRLHGLEAMRFEGPLWHVLERFGVKHRAVEISKTTDGSFEAHQYVGDLGVATRLLDVEGRVALPPDWADVTLTVKEAACPCEEFVVDHDARYGQTAVSPLRRL